MSKIDPRTLLELDIPKTDRQIEYLKAAIEYDSKSKAAEKLGINRRSIDRSIKLVEHKAASVGVAPHRNLTRQTAEGFEAKRISTAYKEDGSVALQWVIQEPHKRDMRAKIEARDATVRSQNVKCNLDYSLSFPHIVLTFAIFSFLP